MDDAFAELVDADVDVRRACKLVGRPRSTHYWRARPKPAVSPPRAPRPVPANALTPPERERVLALLRDPSFVDKSPAQVWARLLDDGTYHGTLQDLRFEARYNLLLRPIALTPMVAAVIPSHSYDTLGESAAGRDFQEYHVGLFAGRFLDPVLPRAYLQAGYSYAYVRQDLDIPLNYSTFGLEAGFFVTDGVQVSFLWNKLTSHGGLTFTELFEAPPEVFVNLDRVVKASYDHVGAAVTVRLGGSLSAYANYLWFVKGKDAHYGSGFSLGLGWSFRTSRADDVPLFPPATGAAAASRRFPVTAPAKSP